MSEADAWRLAREQLYRRTVALGASVGTIIYDEQIFPIASIRLEGGVMVFVGVAQATATVAGAGEIRVHGKDGSLIFETRVALGPGESAEIEPGRVCEFPVLAMDPIRARNN